MIVSVMFSVKTSIPFSLKGHNGGFKENRRDREESD